VREKGRTGMSFTLSILETAVRADLFDPSGGSERWQTSDIDRALDKAVDRYSQYYPNIAYSDMPTQPYQRTYPYPVPANPAYPVLWIERIIEPLQVYGSFFVPPSAGPAAILQAGNGLNIGAYEYAVSWLSQGGESTASPISSITTTSGHQQVQLTIPTGPVTPQIPAIAQNVTIGRNLYRSQAGGTTLNLLGTLGDNTTTSYLDTASDASIINNPAPPAVNTSGVMYWPPFERDFAEYSNLWDSDYALAAGGNMGLQGAVGASPSPIGASQQAFTLKLSSAELPQDNTLVMRVYYATKHQLDSNGSTIPEIHRDIIVLGASAYAMEAYQVPTNDNFIFQDGALRDHIDDTKIPTAWLQASKNRMQQFEQRLQEIKNQRDFASSARTHWGDIAARYERL
jgi:hypothetical protein